MAFDIVRKSFGKEHLWYVEIEINSTIYRFCENRSPIPLRLDAIPTLASQSASPTEVDINGGLGVRASCNVSFDDHLDYAIFGTIQAPVRFWPTWRANHPYYQGARLSLFSGYIIDGAFDAVNFQRRDYVIETFALTRGKVAITAKDPLKLADNNRAQAPRATRGALTLPLAGIPSANTFTLTPTGIGNAQYEVSGWLRIGAEVMEFTRTGDTFTVLRGQYNTIPAAHAAGDTAQQCLRFNDTVFNIEHILLTQFAGVDPAYIPLPAWQDEAELYLPGLYDALITEPVGVRELLKELGEQAPHYLYWDERTNLIQFVAVKPPPDTATTLTDEANILQDSFAYQDMQDMRVSRVIVHFGQFDPTKKLDEFSNYRQTFVRVDTNSETNYGSAKIRTIYSRWIQNANKAAAIRLATRIGRRFHVAPRMFNFSLDAKDADIWTGTACFVDSAWIVNEDGARAPLPAQVISASEADNYRYRALEWNYGASVVEDDDVDDVGSVVVLSGELTSINLRDIYDNLFPSVNPDDDVRFIFDLTCIAGGSVQEFAVDTGDWPELTTPILIDVRGLLIGRGGDGAPAVSFDLDGKDGGNALRLQSNIRLTNTGIIGSGGGGGAGQTDPFSFDTKGGGGGAGFLLSTPFGQKTVGYSGFDVAGEGGNLGQNGADTPDGFGGQAGAAIITNGYTITYIGAGAGDIRGFIV